MPIYLGARAGAVLAESAFFMPLMFATRASALPELENTGVLLDADVVWSM